MCGLTIFVHLNVQIYKYVFDLTSRIPLLCPLRNRNEINFLNVITLALIGITDVMEANLKVILKQIGVDDATISILENQQVIQNIGVAEKTLHYIHLYKRTKLSLKACRLFNIERM